MRLDRDRGACYCIPTMNKNLSLLLALPALLLTRQTVG